VWGSVGEEREKRKQGIILRGPFALDHPDKDSQSPQFYHLGHTVKSIVDILE